MRYVLILFLCTLGLLAAPPEPRGEARELDRHLDILATDLIASLAGQHSTKIALLEFPDLEGKGSALGKYLAEELTSRLFRTGRFRIVERQQLERMLAEQKLSASGLVDEATASRLGRLLGADALLTGTVADLNTSVKVNARLIATETGSIFSVATVKIPMNRELEVLLGRRAGAASTPGQFDGAWEVELVCEGFGRGQGYTYRFTATVKDSVFHGQYGQEGVPPCLTLDGRISPSGTAVILANGLSGDPKFNPRGFRKGLPYFYHIEATFGDSSGTGRRLEMRACAVTFKKP